MGLRYWILKSEPSTYSIDQLQKDKKTNWNGIRNYQARNYLKEMKKGDQALIYHSGDDKAVVGLARIIREGYIEMDDEGKEWVQVDVEFIEKLTHPVKLAQIKSTKSLKSLLLIKQSRLSVSPISVEDYLTIKKMSI